MYGTEAFQIVFGETRHNGELTVTGADIPIGTAYDDSGDNELAELANGSSMGFITKACTTLGATFEQKTLGYKNIPGKSGEKFTLQDVLPGGQVEVENEPAKAYNSADGQRLIVTTGTGDLTAAAKDVLVSFKNGRFYEAQSGDQIWGRVINSACTPIIADSNIRIRMERTSGGIA